MKRYIALIMAKLFIGIQRVYICFYFAFGTFMFDFIFNFECISFILNLSLYFEFGSSGAPSTK